MSIGYNKLDRESLKNYNIFPSLYHARKQSLVNQSTNPFGVVAQKLELLPDDIADITREQISGVTEPLIGWGSPDELMGLAKSSSRTLYADLEPNDRLVKINILVISKRLLFTFTVAKCLFSSPNCE